MRLRQSLSIALTLAAGACDPYTRSFQVDEALCSTNEDCPDVAPLFNLAAERACNPFTNQCVSFSREALTCNNGADDDADTFTDGADSDCRPTPASVSVDFCASGERRVVLPSIGTPTAILDGEVTEPALLAPSLGSVRRVAAVVTIDHQFYDDLALTLVGPSGQSVSLATFTTLSGSGANSWAHDVECNGASACYPPAGDLSAFAGSDLGGVWRLQVADLGAPDSGTLVAWWLVACVA
jgi:hypothetical protein